MRMAFSKMQALGNDFVVLDGVTAPVQLTPKQLQLLGDRRRGVGCDQILVVDPAPDAQADFGYRIFNADGTEVGQCGNGARCLARFVRERSLSAATRLHIATRSTRMWVELLDDDWARARLAPPDFEPSGIVLLAPQQQPRYELATAGGPVTGGAVSVGNPHFVMLVDDVATAPVAQLGAELSHHPQFPDGANIGFVQVVDRARLRLRVYERGVGETPACGSGACAAAVILQRWRQIESQVIIDLPGGSLRIDRDATTQEILMDGPASWVFDGEIEL